MTDIEIIKKFSRILADESAKIINNYFRTSINIDTKSDLTPVTIADKKAEEKMREMIMREFPDHGILGEEFGEYNPDAEFKWILDPIDGTKSFISGVPLFGTLIALTQNGNPVCGAINHPVNKDFLIGDNFNAELYHADEPEGKLVRVRDCAEISDAVLLSTDHLDNYKYRDGKNFEKLVNRVKLYRTWGDCFGYFLVATGFADIMVDPVMSVWDTIALIPVIKGAGGIITDYYGNNPVEGNSIIACSKTLHKVVLETLNNSQKD